MNSPVSHSRHLTKTQLVMIPKARTNLLAEQKRLLLQIEATEIRPGNEARHEAAYFQEAAIHRRLHQINQALQRIHLGTYGRCTRCDAQISRKKLEADHTATLCNHCEPGVSTR